MHAYSPTSQVFIEYLLEKMKTHKFRTMEALYTQSGIHCTQVIIQTYVATYIRRRECNNIVQFQNGEIEQ